MARFTSKKRELMRAVWRLAVLVFGAWLALGPAPALAQDAATPSDTPATDAIGPRDLQNFTLNGTVTRPDDATAEPARQTSGPAAHPRRQDPTATTAAAQPQPQPSAPTQRSAGREPTQVADAQPARQVNPSRAPASTPTARPSSSVTTSLPPIDDAPVSTATTSAALATTADGLGAEH